MLSLNDDAHGKAIHYPEACMIRMNCLAPRCNYSGRELSGSFQGIFSMSRLRMVLRSFELERLHAKHAGSLDAEHYVSCCQKVP
jgi:hypothetical protein